MNLDDVNFAADALQRPGGSDAARSGTRVPDTASGSLFDDVFAAPGSASTSVVGTALPTVSEVAAHVRASFLRRNRRSLWRRAG